MKRRKNNIKSTIITYYVIIITYIIINIHTCENVNLNWKKHLTLNRPTSQRIIIKDLNIYEFLTVTRMIAKCYLTSLVTLEAEVLTPLFVFVVIADTVSWQDVELQIQHKELYSSIHFMFSLQLFYYYNACSCQRSDKYANMLYDHSSNVIKYHES